jgi:uncharacterized YccA/Bax inhibitor family protein
LKNLAIGGKGHDYYTTMDTSNPLLKRESAFSSPWAQAEAMSLQGVINKTGVLLLLCIGAAAFGWTQTTLRMPLLFVGLIGGFILWHGAPGDPGVALPGIAPVAGQAAGPQLNMAS